MGPGNKKKILFIEDDVSTIEVYKTALELAGFWVHTIARGEEAFRKIEELNENPQDKPDLVLLDILLPDANGLDILKRIRELKNIKNLKVLILSNYTSQELEQKGLLLKTEKYLLKTDYVPSDLVKLLKKKLKC